MPKQVAKSTITNFCNRKFKKKQEKDLMLSLFMLNQTKWWIFLDRFEFFFQKQNAVFGSILGIKSAKTKKNFCKTFRFSVFFQKLLNSMLVLLWLSSLPKF